MSEPSEITTLQADSHSPSPEKFAPEIQDLPPEMRTMVSVMAGFFRSNSGPDAETARIMAGAEMHKETCKLQAYTQSMKNRDQQNERDHLFRMKKLDYDSVKNVLIGIACVCGIICGLYLTVKMGNSAVGNPVLLASFLALLGVKPLFSPRRRSDCSGVGCSVSSSERMVSY